MSMIDDDDRVTAECGICEHMAFEPKPCGLCAAQAGHPSRVPWLCRDCRIDCPDCGESVCHDHYDTTAGRCETCEHRRMIESGEAADELRAWGYAE